MYLGEQMGPVLQFGGPRGSQAQHHSSLAAGGAT